MLNFKIQIKNNLLLTIFVFILLFFLLVIFAYSLLSTEAGKNYSDNKANIAYKIKSSSWNTDTIINEFGMMFILIEGGTFMMGSPPDEVGRTLFEKQHEVTIKKDFYMQTTEVSQGQWEKVMGENPSRFSKCGEDCPVENVSWFDVVEFIKKLNQIDSSNNYRLPTEAEWEFACRAGSSKSFSNGEFTTYECQDENALNEIAWYICNSDSKTHPVGSKKPNSLGLYDMHGNVYEWCQDKFINYPDKSDIKNPFWGNEKVCRSCSFNSIAANCRSASRTNISPVIKSNTVGFRLIREAKYPIVTMPNSMDATNVEPKKIIAKDNKLMLKRESVPQKSRINNERFAVQVASFKILRTAEKYADDLLKLGYAAYHEQIEIPQKGIWFRVRVGDYASISDAEFLRKELFEKNIQGIIVKK